MKDISTFEEIKQLVDTFYTRIREDELLGTIFNQVIQDRWPDHLEKMYKFWQTILFEEQTYFGSPFLPHAKLPVTEAHFDRWRQLFDVNMDAQFKGEKAERAKWQAARMAAMFWSKINYYQNHPSIPLK